MNLLSYLEQAIEQKRDLLHSASIQHGLTSEQVMKESQDLDLLLNEYYKKRYQI